MKPPNNTFVSYGMQNCGARDTDKLLFGGQCPQPMRYELWVVIAHPLGPSTITVMKIVILRTKILVCHCEPVRTLAWQSASPYAS